MDVGICLLKTSSKQELNLSDYKTHFSSLLKTRKRNYIGIIKKRRKDGLYGA